MTAIVVGFLLAAALIVYGVERVRANRKHEKIMTVIHADITKRLETIEAKIDGGSLPK